MHRRIIGRFNLNSGRLIVTDPCYAKEAASHSPGAAFSGLVENAAPGEWTGGVTTKAEGRRLVIAELEAQHESHPLQSEPTGEWEPASFIVGVDSGQAGIFDEALYPPGETGQWDGSGGFYDRVCTAVFGAYDAEALSRECPAGSVTEGVVSMSGHGDGGYRCMVYRRADGVCTAVRITFIEGGSQHA